MFTHQYLRALSLISSASLSACLLVLTTPALAESWTGTNVYTSDYETPCIVTLDRDNEGKVERITVSGAALRVSHWSEPKSEVAASLITVGEFITSPELHSMQSFASVPSLAHLGFTRVGLQILTGNLDHPWPGFQDVRYVVKKGDFSEVIAKSELYMMIRMIPLGSDEIHCRDLRAN
jgi:hypothetical protein